MHKRLHRPSLLDDDYDGDDMYELNKNSNRFLKSKNIKEETKPDDIQKHFSSRLNSSRSVTPRSIETDSDVYIDDNEESDNLGSLKSLNNSSSKKSTFGGYDWQPELRKSPRTSFLKQDSQVTNNSMSEQPIDNSKTPNLSKQKSMIIDDPYKIDTRRTRENLLSKSPKDENMEKSNEIKSRESPKSTSEKNKKKANKDNKKDNENNFYEKPDSFLDTMRYKDSVNVSNMFDDINKNFKKSKLKLELDDDEDESHKSLPSSRFLKSQNNKIKEEKPDELEFNRKPKKPRNKFKSEEDLNDLDKPLSSSRFLKTKNTKISKEDFKKSQNTFGLNDNDDEESENSLTLSQSRNSQKSDMSDEKSTKHEHFKDASNKSSEFGSKRNKFDEHKDNGSAKPFPTTRKSKKSSDKSGKSESTELKGSTRFISEDLNKNFNTFNIDNINDNELENSTKLLRMSPPNNYENSFKNDIKPKPRKSQMSNSHISEEPIISKAHKEIQNNSAKDDFKRRSIRFEDEEPRVFPNSSREESPRKSDISRNSSRKSTPSPPTSICEEVVQDPVTLKLRAIQKRREERKRENESKHESAQHKLISESINTIADTQQEPVRNVSPNVTQKRTPRPTSAKYKNVQPKVSTRINLKSLKSPTVNSDWSSSPDLYGNIDPINSERSYTSSQSVRDTAYLQWYLAKLPEKNSKKPPEKAEEDKKKTVTDEERLAAYEAWKNAKKMYFLDLDRKKKEEKEKEKNEIPPLKDPKSAELAFEIWKKKKEQYNKEESKKQVQLKKQKELDLIKEKETKKNKKAELMTEWESKKAKESQEKMLKTKKEEEKKAEKENQIKQKLEEAEIAYREWEGKADLKEKQYLDFEKNKEVLINNRRAWRPSTNAIVKTRRI